MGLFSSSYETQVGTSVTRVIKDEQLPHAVNTGSIKAFFRDGNVSEYIMEELVASIGTRAERMYAYAQDNYTHGLPSGEIYSSTQGRAQVESVIEAAEAQQVLMSYSHYGPPNALHIGWLKLFSQYGYSEVTNTLSVLSTQKGTPVYLKDMVVVVPRALQPTIEPGVLEQWGFGATGGYTPERPLGGNDFMSMTKPSPLVLSDTATAITILVTYCWEVATTTFGYTSTTLSQAQLSFGIADYDDTADFFHAKYYVGNEAKYWMYKYGSGNATLDAVFVNGPEVSGEYFPFAYFRYNKADMSVDKTTDGYKTSKRMLKYLGVDYDVLAESINENPDIANVEQAMLTFSVPPVSTDQVECRYLFDYFDTLYYVQDGNSTGGSLSSNIFALFGRTSGSKNVIVIKDNLFKMTLGNDGIYKRIVAGSIGDIGTYASAYEPVTVTEEYTDGDTLLTMLVNRQQKVHRYKKQIAVGLYEEVTVVGLKMKYYVYGNYTTTGDEIDDILLIPIDRNISKNYSIVDRETLYARGMHFVFNSRVVTEIKWYQSGIFQVVLIVVAIVITVYTYGADGGSAIATALSLSGTAGLIATIVVNLIIGQLIAAAFKVFVKVFGADVATALAIIALIYGAYQVLQNGTAGLITAQRMLMLSTGLQSAVIKAKFGDLLDEADQFKKESEEQTKLLDTAKELLENQHLLQPFVIFGEKPEDFYNRTIHFGNIGTLGITAISSYVDIALTLPKFNDTLGEELDGIS